VAHRTPQCIINTKAEQLSSDGWLDRRTPIDEWLADGWTDALLDICLIGKMVRWID
jgi:hypothetical protein